MSVEFNASQHRFAEFVVHQVKQTDQPRVIFGCGLTGIGKKTVLSEISEEIRRRGGRIITLDSLLDKSNTSSMINSENHLVAAFTPSQFEVIKKETTGEGVINQLGLGLVGVRVMTMTADEAQRYISGLRQSTGIERSDGELANEFLAALTMGIYAHINKYFELRKAREFYQPINIYNAIINDLPRHLKGSFAFTECLASYSDLYLLYGKMGSLPDRKS